MKMKPLLDAVISVPSEAAPPTHFRRWTLGLLGTVLSSLVILGITVAVVDPLMQYHRPWFGLQSVMWKETYLNPGLARNYDFDAAVIGGSFVQNTKVSELEALYGIKAIKLTNSGGSIPRVHELLRLTFGSGTHKKAVFISVPTVKFGRAPEEAAAFDGPAYLYDANPFNDIGYWLNIDVLGHLAGLGAKAVVGKLKPQSEAAWLDDAYAWYPKFKTKFDKKYILAHYFPPKPSEMRPFDYWIPNAKANWETLVKPFVEAHPETTFYFFYPPFSRLLWRDNYVSGVLAAHMGIYRWLTVEMLKYPNVKVFNFMNFDPYSSNLNNYKDRSHYGPDANKRMFEAMAWGEYQVTSTPTQEELDAFMAWARDYQDADIPVYQGNDAAETSPVDDEAAMADNQEVQF